VAARRMGFHAQGSGHAAPDPDSAPIFSWPAAGAGAAPLCGPLGKPMDAPVPLPSVPVLGTLPAQIAGSAPGSSQAFAAGLSSLERQTEPAFEPAFLRSAAPDARAHAPPCAASGAAFSGLLKRVAAGRAANPAWPHGNAHWNALRTGCRRTGDCLQAGDILNELVPLGCRTGMQLDRWQIGKWSAMWPWPVPVDRFRDRGKQSARQDVP
jgi:hypothetical protein